MRDSLSVLSLLVSVLAATRLVRLVTEDSFPPIKAVRDRIVDANTEHRVPVLNGEIVVGYKDKPNAWAELVQCPWCAGMYICAGVVALHLLIWSWWRPAAIVLAFSMVVGLIESRVDVE